MFVCSVKGDTIKFAGIIAAAAAALVAIILMLPSTANVSAGSVLEDGESVNYEKIRTNENRLEFLNQFGWEAKENCVEETEIKIPGDFDKVMNSYNEVQKSQGLDLSKYKGKSVNRYTYEITNYPGYDGTVFANIIVYKNRVIGGDVCSSDVAGFIHGFEMPGEG